jgi:large-conductance mechanosensitive channel
MWAETYNAVIKVVIKATACDDMTDFIAAVFFPVLSFCDNNDTFSDITASQLTDQAVRTMVEYSTRFLHIIVTFILSKTADYLIPVKFSCQVKCSLRKNVFMKRHQLPEHTALILLKIIQISLVWKT